MNVDYISLKTCVINSVTTHYKNIVVNIGQSRGGLSLYVWREEVDECSKCVKERELNAA